MFIPTNFNWCVSGWASRVYFSDNGSTAVEIALKMAFRKFLSDNKVILDPVKADIDRRFMDLKVSETFLDRGHMLRNYCSSCSLPLCYFLPLSLKLNVLGKFHFTAKFLSGSAFILFFPQLVVKRDCQLPVGVRTNFRKSRLHALWLACLRKY